jgi:hypothetical protein
VSQKSKVAGLDIFCENTTRDLIADSCTLNRVAEVACAFSLKRWKRNGLDYTWSGTALYAKRKRTLPADQFEMRAVRTRRGITMVGFFSASITRARHAVSGGHCGEADWPE